MSDKPLTTGITLDSWAVLAWLQGEPAGILVRDLLNWRSGKPPAAGRTTPLLQQFTGPPDIFMNIINLGEVFYILGRKKGVNTATQTINRIRQSIEIVPATNELVLKAASIKMRHAVTYADAFALATAKEKKSLLMTGDPEIKETGEAEIFWIGPP
ncbi:type II toxin-antitoxin system VapC family toxin [Desulfofundulus thermobenzoicus]|nr:type II toxin-antitoxin system VapC family toxin [Desulfofundulus thermobenzoicus]